MWKEEEEEEEGPWKEYHSTKQKIISFGVEHTSQVEVREEEKLLTEADCRWTWGGRNMRQHV